MAARGWRGKDTLRNSDHPCSRSFPACVIGSYQTRKKKAVCKSCLFSAFVLGMWPYRWRIYSIGSGETTRVREAVGLRGLLWRAVGLGNPKYTRVLNLDPVCEPGAKNLLTLLYSDFHHATHSSRADNDPSWPRKYSTVHNTIPSSQSHEMAVLDTGDAGDGGGGGSEDRAPLLPAPSSNSPAPLETEPEAKGYWLWALTLSAGISGLLFGCTTYTRPSLVWPEHASFG